MIPIDVHTVCAEMRRFSLTVFQLDDFVPGGHLRPRLDGGPGPPWRPLVPQSHRLPGEEDLVPGQHGREERAVPRRAPTVPEGRAPGQEGTGLRRRGLEDGEHEGTGDTEGAYRNITQPGSAPGPGFRKYISCFWVIFSSMILRVGERKRKEEFGTRLVLLVSSSHLNSAPSFAMPSLPNLLLLSFLC